VTEQLRRESLEALARKFIGEAMRLDFSKTEINQMVKDQLKAWNQSEESDSE
jgi:DNA-binding transcriptional regulator YhcF (GntR family)